MDILLENGKTMIIENCGDALKFTMYDENGEIEEEVSYVPDTIADMVFYGC